MKKIESIIAGKGHKVPVGKTEKTFPPRPTAQLALTWLLPILVWSLTALLTPDRANADHTACSSLVPLGCGETKSGQIVIPDETDCFQFDAQAGEVVSITTAGAPGSSDFFHPCWELFAPDGSQVGDGVCGQAERTLLSGGTHTLKISDDFLDGEH